MTGRVGESAHPSGSAPFEAASIAHGLRDTLMPSRYFDAVAFCLENTGQVMQGSVYWGLKGVMRVGMALLQCLVPIKGQRYTQAFP